MMRNFFLSACYLSSKCHLVFCGLILISKINILILSHCDIVGRFLSINEMINILFSDIA